MSADDFLGRLEKVRQKGRGQWMACCPAHADKSPSMTVRELEDGRVLVHCFAGCDVESILDAVGLTFDALFPERVFDDRRKPLKRPFNAHDVLAAVRQEMIVVAVAGADMLAGRALEDRDRERLRMATDRINAAAMLVSGD